MAIFVETIATRVVDAFEGSDFRLTRADLELLRSAARTVPSQKRSLATVLDLIYRSYCSLNGFSNRRWGDKTPLNILDIRMIENVFPAAQYIHIIRDPRAVALSIMKAAETSRGIRERSYAEAAVRWKKSIRNARALATRIGPQCYAEVRYEDLVHHPERELRRLCGFLGLYYSDAMLELLQGASKLGDVTTVPHLERVGKPLDAGRSDAWTRSISKGDRIEVERVTARYRKLLGYP